MQIILQITVILVCITLVRPASNTFAHSLQIIPERAQLCYTNDSYVKDVVLNVRKLGRRGIYVANVYFTLINDAGSNITVDFLFYEYLHNEYKRTFVEMHFPLCDMINNDKMVGSALRKAGLACPIKAGIFALQNLSIPNVDNFPYVWPFERARVNGNYFNPKTGVVVANGSLYITFKNNRKKP